MTTQNEERDPFPEPQTIPSGWDLSEFFSTNTEVTLNADDSKMDSVN